MNKKKIYTLSYSNILNPPPYLYQLEIQANFTDQGVYLKYNKHFLNREGFSEEELEDEGFSLNDDMQLDGTLGKAWSSYFQMLLDHSKWSSNKPSEGLGNILSLQLSDEKGIRYTVFPKIEYLLEEIYQAILETAQIEAPLSLHLKKVHKGIDKTVELVWHFKDRSFEVISNSQKKNTTWEEGQNWLSQFYEIDLIELPTHKKKLPEGKVCINPGDDFWYELPSNKNWEKIFLTLFPN